MEQLCDSSKQRIIIKIMLDVLEVKPVELARHLHLSKTQVSRYLSGERISEEIDFYLILQVFRMKIKAYDRIQNIGETQLG